MSDPVNKVCCDRLLTYILVLLLAACSGSGGNSPGNDVPYISWEAPTEREDGTLLGPGELTGFRVYYGNQPGDYSGEIEINDHTAVQMVLERIPSGTYFVAITAVDIEGRESALSPEVMVVH